MILMLCIYKGTYNLWKAHMKSKRHQYKSSTNERGKESKRSNFVVAFISLVCIFGILCATAHNRDSVNSRWINVTLYTLNTPIQTYSTPSPRIKIAIVCIII